MRLSDIIEQFIKNMMEQDAPSVDLKRNELAEYFHCAPSQINYVLSTRFTPDLGYVTSSVRGGGGYIRIVRIVRTQVDELNYLLQERLGDSVDVRTTQSICSQLRERGLITREEAQLMLSAISPDALSAPMPETMKNAVRARIMRSMLLSIAQRRKE